MGLNIKWMECYLKIYPPPPKKKPPVRKIQLCRMETG